MGAIKLADRAPREEVLYFKATINQTNSITEAPIQFIKKSMPAEVAIPFPPFKNKNIKLKIDNLDGVIFTHAHADHMHGIDDLRMIFFKRRSMLPVWADYSTSIRIRESFEYLVKQKSGTKYPPILLLNEIKDVLASKELSLGMNVENWPPVG